MIETPTVFILGAGASNPYGYPLGKDLVDNIINEISNIVASTDLSTLVTYYKVDGNKFNLLQQALGRSHPPSIDYFIERNPSYKDIGKFLIVKCLSQYENSPNLNLKKCNWYNYLFYNIMDNSIEKFGNNKISFITFNYDRSLEQFFHIVLTNLYQEYQIEDHRVQLENINIVHLYGYLGDSIWPSMHRDIESYKISDNIDHIWKLKDHIKIIDKNDSIDDDPEFKKAYKLLEKAEMIYFLGFGYNDINIERLRINNLPQGKTLRGTLFNSTDSEKTIIKKRFTYSNSISLYDQDVYSFLRNQIIK